MFHQSEEPVLALGPANARPAGQIAAKLGAGVFVGTFKGELPLLRTHGLVYARSKLRSGRSPAAINLVIAQCF